MSEQYEYMEQALIDAPQFPTDIDYERRINHQRRRLRRQFQSLKHSREQSEKLESQAMKRVNIVNRERRQSLLQGIKFKNKLEKLSEVQQVSTILLMERQFCRRKELEELERKKENYYTQRENSQKMGELSLRAYLDRKVKSRQRVFQQQMELEAQKIKSIEQSQEKRRQGYLKRREEQERLRQKQEKINEYKIKKAQQNYAGKVEELIEKQKMQENLIEELYKRQLEHQQLMKKTQRVGKSSEIVSKLLTGSNFELTTI